MYLTIVNLVQNPSGGSCKEIHL